MEVSILIEREELLDVDSLLNQCTEMITNSSPYARKPFKTFTSESEAIGALGECAIERYLNDLCADSDILIDNRSTLRRYGLIVIPKSKAPLCGRDQFLQYKLLTLSQALAVDKKIEFVIGINFHLEITSRELMVTLTPQQHLLVESMPSSTVADRLRKEGGKLSNQLENHLASMTIDEMMRNAKTILEKAKEYISSYINTITNMCGGLLLLNSYFISFPDIICVKLAEDILEDTVQLRLKARIDTRTVELGKTSLEIRAKVRKAAKLVLIEAKSSGKSLHPDAKLINEVKEKVQPLTKLGIPLEAYLLYLFYRRNAKKAKIKLFRIY